MSKLLVRFLFLIVLFVHLDCEVFRDRPRIKTNEGNLIVEPAFDKNIYLQTNGPKSTVFVGGINILNINLTDNIGRQDQPVIDDSVKYNSILRRLERLENRDTQPSDLLFNITILWRRVNRLTTRVSSLQSLINNGGRDSCQSHPCAHGGTCLNLVNGYHCLCPSNWEGKDCDQDVDECRHFQGTDLGCQNGARCRNTPGSYECECRPGWYGQHCTRRAMDCNGGNFEMCGYGTCIPTNTGSGIKCICDQGWTTNGTGVACLTDVNECKSSQGPRCSVNPTVECINLPGSFRCGLCPAGYEGDGYICSDIDECLTTPNGGCSTSPLVTCHNTIGSRICGACPPGYQGDGITCTWRGSCNINRGGCHPSAQCIDNPALGGQIAQCICPPGMEGDGIGLNGCYVPTGNFTRGCEMNPCGVHGQCHPLRSGYTCICYRGYGGAHCDSASNYCASQPCLNGGSCRPDESSPRGFRCECTAQFSGDLCHVAAKTCGGLLQAEEGSIVYPLTNTTYNHNSRCAWVIQTDRDKVINVTFSKFNLEANPECLYDFLQIHDGRSSASQIIGRFCGNEFPKGGNIISSHNNLYFWFRSDQTVAKDGFALHWNSINPVCGGTINATTHGHISSPGSPGQYPPNRDCYWHLLTDLGKRIQLHFFALDIESHSNCSYDFLAIYDGERTTDPLLSKYCSSAQPAPVQSAGSDLLIHFHSDAYGSGYGFQLAYAPADGVPGCGGFYTSDRGEIVSPAYDGKYLSNLLCEYKIKTSPDTKIRLNFISFKLESSFRCKYDYVKIYDGPSQDSRFVGKFCGSTFPKSYTSSSNQIYIKFKSDHSMSADGFRITYETICQQTILGDSGVVKSPGYPFSYPENKMCEYIIGTSPGKAIKLTFQDFDIEDNNYYNCRYDNVEIRDGADVNATLLGKYCGGTEHTPPMLVSTHNFMYIKFTSDLSISGTGFYANYTTIDTECGGIYREPTGHVNHPSGSDTIYKNDQTCTWMLIAPPGMHIKLTWNRFDLENMPSCRSDYVELNEIDENNELNLLGKYCGVTFPPAITTTSPQLQIKFQSDSSVRSAGFSVSYTFLDEKTHCGGLFTKAHGRLYSPGWPKRYENSRDCIWTIQAPAGQQIKLNISQFELERPVRMSCDFADYLEIRNGASNTSPLIGKYCGSFESKRIVSLANVLYLHFHSDSYITGKGFQIEWDSTAYGCGGTLTSPSGTIASPNYPLSYNENAECFYKIVTSAGSRIRVSFTELDLERTINCRDDYVQIYDGRDENSPSLGTYCVMSPRIRPIESSTNYLYIKFRSDFYISSKGFLLEYSTICQHNMTGSHGVIESPGYPGTYPTNLDCLWTIIVPKGNKINVTFTLFDVYKSGRLRYRLVSHYGSYTPMSGVQSCDNDYVQMKELTDINFGEKMCGTTLPKRISSKSNSLQVKFITSLYTFPKSGFRLEWARHGCGGYLQKTYGTIHLDRSMTSSGELECEWILETSPGTSVTINIGQIYMTDSVNCTTDAIEIYNGRSINDQLLTKVCHHSQELTTVTSTDNVMLVRFVKHSTLKDVNFSAYFNGHMTGCGGRIEALSGIIHSKNYPKNYENSMNCLWTILVPRYHRIEFNFMEFDLYSSNTDTDCGDSVKIYDGDMVLHSNYSQRICPNNEVSQIISKSNVLGVRFQSDNFGTAKGFKANFTVICGGTIKSTFYGGIINTEKWLATRISNNCTWTILAPSLDKKISLIITHMSIPKNTDIITTRKCPSSYLRVYDGNDVDAPVVDEFCGHKVPPMIVSHGSAITLVLGTYNGTVEGQFYATYSTLTTACGGILTSEEGSIASPNYPLSYPNKASCEWTLSTSPGNRVYITFEQFDLEYSENCNEDYLEVRENNGAGRLLGVYCGTDIPTNTTAATKLFIKFHSGPENNGRGFLLHYGFLHGNEISGVESGEIASPLYPHIYEDSGEYSWRINVEGSKLITVLVDILQIPTLGTSCYNSLVVYDGYDEDAPVLEEYCGMLTEQKQLKTTSNVAFIKLTLDESNTGSMFHIRWASGDANTEATGDTVNCGFNETRLLSPGEKITIKSPGYDGAAYDNDLNCEWVFKASPGNHLNLHFLSIKLEQTPMCFADYVSVYSSESISTWSPVKENICLSEQGKQDLNSTTYMKIVFKTDSSITREGFEAQVSSACGGITSGLSGVIGPNWNDTVGKVIINCEWTIKVRPGRTILLSFDSFNITNPDSQCVTYVKLRNGNSAEAPMLADGKYCGLEHENRQNIESSSNAVFVSYSTFQRSRTAFGSFRLRFEEKGYECGVTASLDSDHKWEIISSPNYPSVPVPYSECLWVFHGPPGEILRVDFLDRFDLDRTNDCTLEYVEIREGSSDLSPLKGRYCKEMPGTIKTTGNVIYVKYYTQLADPKNGFKANVSIDVCGGTIKASKGEVISPGYPHMQTIPYGSVCEWKIIGNPRQVLLLKPQDIQLPESEAPCATKITVEETVPVNNTITVLQTFCSEQEGGEEYTEDKEDEMSLIQTSSNEVSIKFHMGKPAEWTQTSTNRGFRFTFNSSFLRCGGQVTTPEGFLATPAYPRDTTLRYCQWQISLPDKSRRVHLEILDSGIQTHTIGMYNDFDFQSSLHIIKSGDVSSPRVFESSGPKLSIYVLLNSPAARHRFKAKFSSDEPALCGGTLTDLSGELMSPNIDRPYMCEWHYSPNQVSNSSDFKTLYVTVKGNSSTTRNRCGFQDPRLKIRSTVSRLRRIFYTRIVCGNQESTFRIPSSEMDLKASKSSKEGSYLEFHLKWKLQPCGGVVEVGANEVNMLNVPSNYNDTLDCAWIVLVPSDQTRVQIKLDGSFVLDCDNEFVKIGDGIEEVMPIIGDYCKDRLQEAPLITKYRNLLVQYHSNVKNETQVRLMIKSVTQSCGGILREYETMFESPNYPENYDPNIECTWEIIANLGNRISLQFINRFVIEDRVNCTKDAVIIYDWQNGKYTQVSRLCGRTLPPVFNSTMNRMKVVLRTDSETNLDGFRAWWTTICGGKINATSKEQILYSPGWPDNYLPNADCTYVISGGNKKISLKFLEFELEGNYPSCEFDNFTMSAYNNYDYLEETYCGSQIPPSVHNFDKVTLTFKSDSYISRKGFKLLYSYYECGGEIKEPTVISSTPDGERYTSNENCTWIIEAPADKIIVLKFQDIDLETSNECYSDYVAIFNGKVIDEDKRVALLCGHVKAPTIFRSTGNTMVVQFVSDVSVQYKGFKADVFFSYSSAVGCGGHIELTTTAATHTFKSPLIARNVVYENFLDCEWTVNAPASYAIKVEFKSFHVASCDGVNQTALGFSKCDCDYVEVKDGINPKDIVIGTYCGHTLPPQVISSQNTMSVRLFTDGEIASSGFEAVVTTQRSVCDQSFYSLTRDVVTVKSFGYSSGVIPRGLHCVYHFLTNPDEYSIIHFTIKNLDLRPGEPDPNQCNKDKLVVKSIPRHLNTSVGKDFVLDTPQDYFYSNSYIYIEDEMRLPDQYEFCGMKKDIDLYLTGSVTVYVQTSPDSDSKKYKGMEIQVSLNGFCGRNYTEPQGRISSSYGTIPNDAPKDCYTLITAPENFTISVYFLHVQPNYYDEDVYLDIYDGNSTAATRLHRVNSEADDDVAVFSTGTSILLHNHFTDTDFVTYDLNYVTSDKGRGCGGKLHNLLGKVYSPMYPSVYRQKGSCEWEIETTTKTRVRLHFTVFDLGRSCDQNYVQLVDRSGKVISTYCDEIPADYTSTDNYVKIVFTTSMNNAGTGWIADFIAVL
ncbi:cubilin homolog [Pectinophora gossypiella]|uniref:cubilin homolog n=1 Tax=Pectinophora gossypiella TaxID=13191 RepID=UPI00214EECA2|nr:cubilin homolog [Pectinophora gossypiella]